LRAADAFVILLLPFDLRDLGGAGFLLTSPVLPAWRDRSASWDPGRDALAGVGLGSSYEAFDLRMTAAESRDFKVRD